MTEQSRVADLIAAFAKSAELPLESTHPGSYVLTIPGTHKLTSTVGLLVGDLTLSVNAFVARRPDENVEAVYRWLLERNRSMYAVAFSVDQLGDIYLTGRMPLAAITADELDRIIGSVAEYADGSFNTILELGFATAIRREWAWRISRGESTANLEAFRHLADTED